MTRRSRSLLLALLVFAGCRSFGPPTAGTLQRVAPMPLAGQLGGTFVLELESDQLAGVFDGVWDRSDGVLRVQLFPDIGGKVLDVTARQGGLAASTPDGDYRAPPPLADAEPHLALVLAGILAELVVPPTSARVLAERAAEGGRTEVRLRPALGGGEVTATLGAGGAVEAYRFWFGWLTFDLDGTGAFSGPGFSGRVCP